MLDVRTTLLINPQTVMNGFCFIFCEGLLRKLKELIREDRVFECGVKEATKKAERNIDSNFTLIARMVIQSLLAQVSLDDRDHNKACLPNQLSELVSAIEEFLGIPVIKTT